MTSDEGMMRAACVIRDAVDQNHRQADRVEEALLQMRMIFDAGYGGVASQLLAQLSTQSTYMTHIATLERDLAEARKREEELRRQLAICKTTLYHIGNEQLDSMYCSEHARDALHLAAPEENKETP
jgi:hypothetical protein